MYLGMSVVRSLNSTSSVNALNGFIVIVRKEAITVEEERQQFLDESHTVNAFHLSTQVSLQRQCSDSGIFNALPKSAHSLVEASASPLHKQLTYQDDILFIRGPI